MNSTNDPQGRSPITESSQSPEPPGGGLAADRIDGKHVYAATNARGHWMIWMQDDRPPIEKLLRGPQEVGRDSAEEWVQWWDEHIDYWRSEAVDPAEYRQLVEAMRKAHRFIESKTSGEESTQAGMALLNALDRNRQRSLKVSGGSDTEWIIPNIAANPSPSQSGGERLREAAESFKNAADAYVETKLQPEFADEYYRERVGLAAALEGERDGGGPFAGINILTDERVPDGCVGILHDGELEVFRLSDGEKVGPEGPGGEGE